MTRDEIIRIAQEAGYNYAQFTSLTTLERFAAIVAAAEREACIKILSAVEFTSLEHMPSEAALVIRAAYISDTRSRCRNGYTGCDCGNDDA